MISVDNLLKGGRQQRRNRKKQRRRVSKKGLLLFFLLLTIGGVIGIFLGTRTPLLMSTPLPLEKPATPVISLNELNSQGMVLYDMANERLIFEKNKEERVYPASLTKVMTAVVVLENVEDLEEKMVVSGDIFPQIESEGASVAGFLPGEEVSVKDLLYGLLLPSGADAALALSHRISGSEEAFVGLMNEKAKILGMDNTYFSTATGLQKEGQVTTSADLLKLLTYALNDPRFASIWGNMTYEVPSTNLHPEGLLMESTVLKRIPSLERGNILGGKTGFTDEAGLCLILTYEVDGSNYLLIMTGCPGTPENSFLQQNDINYVNNYIGI